MDGGGDADACDAPGADATFRLQALHRRDDAADIGRPGGGELVALVLAARIDVVVGADVGVQEVDVDALQPHRREAGFERGPDAVFGLARRRRSQTALAGEPHALGRSPLEGLGDHRLAVPIERGGVDQVDPGVGGRAQGGDRFGLAGLAPELPEAAAAQREAADGGQGPQRVGLHHRLPLVGALAGPSRSARAVQGADLVAVRVAQVGEVEPVLALPGRIFDRGPAVGQAGGVPGVRLRLGRGGEARRCRRWRGWPACPSIGSVTAKVPVGVR